MAWILIVLFLYVSWTDLRHRRIPNRALLAGLLVAGLIGANDWPADRWLLHIGIGAGIAFAFGLAAWFWPDLFGMGDVKLLSLLAFALGLRPFAMILTFACLVALLVSLLLLLGKRIRRGTPLPFAPFLTLGLLLHHALAWS